MILTTVPTSIRTPGVFTEFEFVANAQPIVALPNRVVINAEVKGGSQPIETPFQVFSETDGDAKCGIGTLAALGVRMAFAQGKFRNSTPEVWVCGMAEPGGGAQATETITLTGPATQSGTIYPRISGRIIPVGVNVGDSANTIAAALGAAISALATTLPVVATVAGAVVTCKCVTKGVNGNDIAYDQAPGTTLPTGVTMAFAQTVAGAGACVITNALNALYDRRYHGVCSSNHTATDAATMIVDRASDWGFAVANYRHYFMGCRDSLATAGAIQAAANDFGVIVAVCEGAPRMPIELAVAAAIDWFSYDAPNANIDNDVLLLEPPSGALAFSATEIEAALAGGLTPLVPSGSYSKIVRLTSTQITVAGVPATDLYRDPAYARTDAWLAEQVAIAVTLGTAQATQTPGLLTDVRDIVVEVDRATELLGYVKDVDTFLDQIQTVYASSPGGRLLATNPHRVVPPNHQTVIHSTMYP